jgi:hypothetical protein
MSILPELAPISGAVVFETTVKKYNVTLPVVIIANSMRVQYLTYRLVHGELDSGKYNRLLQNKVVIE